MRDRPILPPGMLPGALWFAALAVLLTWPLAAHLSTHVPGAGAGDNMMFLWNAWWMREAVWSGESFFHSGAIVVPVGVDLVQHTHTALPAFAAATLLAWLPVVPALNLTILASYTLNGLCAWLLAGHLTRRPGAALLAGTCFAAAPYFAGHLLGHFNLVSAWLLPLFLLVAITAIERGSSWRAAAAGLVLVAAAYSDYYYLAYLLVLLAIVVVRECVRWDGRLGPRRANSDPALVLFLALAATAALAAMWITATGGGVFEVSGVRISATSGRNLRTAAWLALLAWWWRRHRPVLRARVVWSAQAARVIRTAAVAATVLVIGAAPLLAGGIALWQAGEYASPAYSWLSGPRGVDVVSLVGGNPFHPVWGEATRAIYRWAEISLVEGTAWLGLLPLVVLAARLRAGPAGSEVRFWLSVGGVFLVWALGPRLVVLGADTGLVLPATVIRFVPVLSNVRMPARAIVVVYLALSMLLALWWASRPRSAASACLVLGVILADFLPAPVATYRLPDAGAYAALAGLPPGAVLELPIGLRDGFGEVGLQKPETMYYQTVHGRPITGGAVARLPESTRQRYLESDVLGPLLRLSSGERLGDVPRVPAAEAYAALGIRYVVFDRQRSTAELARYLARMPIRRLGSGHALEVYAIE